MTNSTDSTDRTLLADTLAPSSAGPASERRRAAVRSSRRVAILATVFASLTLSGALAAAGAVPNDFECRRASRVEYKAVAAECELLSSSADQKACIAEARSVYRAEKRSCGSR